mmetsp:Transcript_7666/g.18073  ORF Transcript_7666/g.18073 Transcript_7666/m.18073 type:complete len:213 (+) Transcript_7666:638-1276(+)
MHGRQPGLVSNGWCGLLALTECRKGPRLRTRDGLGGRGWRLRPVLHLGADRNVPLRRLLVELTKAVGTRDQPHLWKSRRCCKRVRVTTSSLACSLELLMLAPPTGICAAEGFRRLCPLLLPAFVLLCGDKSWPTPSPLGRCIEHLGLCLGGLAVDALWARVLQLPTDALVLVYAVRGEVATTIDAPHPSVLQHLRIKLRRAHGPVLLHLRST